MNPKYSLIVSFLLHLKGLFVQTDSVLTGPVCAPTGSTLTLRSRCNYPDGYIFQSISWKHRTINGENLVDPSKDSRYRNDSCDLTIHGLKETDAGTYYMSFTYRKENSTLKSSICIFIVYVTDLQVTVDSERVTEGHSVTLTCKTSCPPTASKRSFIWWKNEMRLDLHYQSHDALHFSAVSREDSGRYSCALEDFERFSSAEMLLSVNPPDVNVNEGAGIVTLSSLLTLVALLMICAALWTIRKKRQSLKRPEGKEPNKQNDTVYENDQTPDMAFDLEDWQDGSENTCVYFRLHSKIHHKTSAEETIVVFHAFGVSHDSAAPQ